MSQNASKADISEQTSKSSMIDTEKAVEDEEEEPDLKEIEIEDIAVGAKPKEKSENEKAKKPKAANTAS